MIRVKVTKTSNWQSREVKEFVSLDECIRALYGETGCEDYVVSVPVPQDPDYEYIVEIYDCYRE